MALEDLPKARLSVDGTIKDVRADHVARYRWAAERLTGHVVDAGCNCGYGSAILADSGLKVVGMDNWRDGIAYARANWFRPGIAWVATDFEWEGFIIPSCDGVVAFEVLEHMEHPERLLTAAVKASPALLASVPNERIWPHEERLAPEHKRHYTREQFEELLTGCGWSEIEWFGQRGGRSPVKPGVEGRTLVVACHR